MARVKGGRKRVKTVKKAKRWKKGQSSSSNPETKKFRDHAKNRFFHYSTGPSDLTVEALAQHDASQADSDGDEVLSDFNSDAKTLTARTFSTWATNWTDCSNATFGRVHKYWGSNSAVHKEILAVLAAVTEVIKSQGGKGTETEYFAALMTTLTTVDSADSMAAVTYLLSLAIKRVPKSVLKSKFSEVSKTLLDVLAGHVTTDRPALLRSTIVCLAQLLRAQEVAVWSNSSTMQIYNGLLAFLTHDKPKVRKAAQEAVTAILRGSSFMLEGNKAPPHHPAAAVTAKYCIKLMESSGGSSASSDTLHTLGLLKDILGILPQQNLKATCETLLKVMTLADVMLTSVAMKALHGMFVMQPKVTSLDPALNAQIITALYSYQPGQDDVQPMTAWLAVMEPAHINMARNDKDLCLSHLPRMFGACMTCLRSEKLEIAQAGTKTLISLLGGCVGPAAEKLARVVTTAAGNTPLHRMFRTVEAGLTYKYHATWGLVLKVLGVFFEVIGRECHQIMKKCLLSMADLRDSHQFPFKADLDHAMGLAVRAMGPRVVLEAVPLQITGTRDDYGFPRSWLLPILRDSIRDTELDYFTSFFLPLAAKLRTTSMEFGQKGRHVEAKTYDAIQRQIWSLLPGFCICPTDLSQSFKGIAKVMGTAIADRPDLRMDVMASLRKLISQSLNNEEHGKELGRFSKNFLPILFNLFTAEPEKERDSTRLAVMETIKCYLQVTDKQMITTFFDRAFAKLQEVELAAFTRYALMDMTLAMIPYLNQDDLRRLYSHVTSQLKNPDKTVQKKSYRALEEMCSGKSAETRSFVTITLSDLQQQLLNSLSISGPSSKAPRLRCLIYIFRQLDTSQIDFLTTVIPEAILCTRVEATRARQAAFTLLVEMGNALIRWSPEQPKQEILRQYFELLVAGLAGSPQMVSCTVHALSRVIFEFKDSIQSSLLTVLLENTCLLLTSKAREIVQSALGLVTVLLAAFPESLLAQFLQKLISSLVTMKEDNRHHFRFKAKAIFTKLTRKFGYQIIHDMLPASHHKLLANIRKTQERAKKQKKAAKTAKEEEESGDEEEFLAKEKIESVDELLRDTDSELEDDNDVKKGRPKKAGRRAEKRGAAWLKEEGVEEIVDFLDPAVSQKVLATKPSGGARGGVKHDFKMAPDGRLIISDDKEKEQTKEDILAEDDDLDDLMATIEGPGKKSRKRKLPVSADDDIEPDMTYKAGGKGIHRPVDKRAKEDLPGKEYKAKKAGGDIKKKGKPDPFAYVPLQSQFLNKRKKAKAAGQFNNLVRGAKKGAMKGKKMRKSRR